MFTCFFCHQIIMPISILWDGDIKLCRCNTQHTQQSYFSVVFFLVSWTKKFSHWLDLNMWKTLKKTTTKKQTKDKKIHSYSPYQKRSFRDAPINRKITGISVFNGTETILKKINVSFIHHFCSGIYSFSLNTCWTHVYMYYEILYNICK